QITPNDARAHFGLGVAYRRLGYFDDAIDAYRAALHIRPDDARARRRARKYSTTELVTTQAVAKQCRTTA
ncbi:unnamed protein product, partial [marine sediment metagenome]